MAIFSFFDLSGGGFRKTNRQTTFVEARDEATAVAIFERETGVNPYGQTCPCCGDDFSIYEMDDEPGIRPDFTEGENDV